MRGGVRQVIGYLRSLVDTMMAAHDRLYVEQHNFDQRTIGIDTLGVGTTEFDLSPERAATLRFGPRRRGGVSGSGAGWRPRRRRGCKRLVETFGRVVIMLAWILVGFTAIVFVSGSLGGIVSAILINNRPPLSEDVAEDAGVHPKRRGEVLGPYFLNGFLGGVAACVSWLAY